ncbi:MAG: DNA polymerase I [Candidatus Eremiobacteraeota bacterium]|nr:DNA polymerase I [Candidatus Eremiobacteraeota bacterium]
MPPADKHPRLLILDGHSMAYRAFYALPPLHTSRKEPVNAVYGFINMLQKVISLEKPDYIAASFDLGKPTGRIEEYPEYKATREAAPEDFQSQVGLILELMSALKIPVYYEEGYEADDCIATIACKAKNNGIEVLIVSGDLDLLQIVSDHVTVLVPKKGISNMVRYDTDAVIKRYGIKPEQLVDMKALAGDTSDNIPGVPGIGIKTASKLIKEYGHLEGIFENLEKLPPRLKNKITEYRTRLLRDKKILNLNRDLLIEIKTGEMKFQGLHTEEADKIYSRLEFRSLVKSSGEGKETQPEKYTVVKDDGALENFLEIIKKASSTASYLKTGSGLGIYVSGTGGFYFPYRNYLENEEEGSLPPGDPGDMKRIQKALRGLLDSEMIIGYWIKRDLPEFGKIPIKKEKCFFDVKLAGYLLDPEGSLRLGDFFKMYLYPGHEWEQVEKGDENKIADSIIAGSRMLLSLKKKIEEKLKETEMDDLFWGLEMPLLFVLNRMEHHGIGLDVKYLEELSSEMDKEIKKIESEIFEMAGHEFNIGSPRQVGQVLFKELELPALEKTEKTKAASTSATALMQIRDKHPIVDLILDYRELTKLKSTYVDTLPRLVSKLDGRLHTSFNQMTTATGRLSSSEPNLQNIPVHGRWGLRIRRAFIAEKGRKLVGADYSQIELRVMAHMSNDPRLISAFKKGEDIHTATAADVFGISPGDVTPDMRRKAKEINFGIMYGMRAHGLAQRLNISRTEAKEYVDKYFERFSGVREFISKVIEKAREKGYVETLLGRRRYLPGINSRNYTVRSATERIAINAPLQGTAADIIKLAMINVERRLVKEFTDVKERPKLLISIHDELLLEVKQEFVPRVVELVKEVMEGVFSLRVPLIVDISVGENWAEMKK